MQSGTRGGSPRAHRYYRALAEQREAREVAEHHAGRALLLAELKTQLRQAEAVHEQDRLAVAERLARETAEREAAERARAANERAQREQANGWTRCAGQPKARNSREPGYLVGACGKRG